MGSNGKLSGTVAAYSLIAGAVYLLIGLVEVLNGVGILDLAVIPADIAEGLTFLVIASLYVAGMAKRSQGEQDSLLYVVVGSLFATVIFSLYMSVMGANCLGYLLQFEDWLGWTWLDDLRPAIWLFPLAIPGIYQVIKRRVRLETEST